MKPYPVWVPVLLGALALWAGCETRARNNPFDPDNPETGGTPPLVQAVAGNHQVELSWDLSSFRDIASLRLLRREGDGAEAIQTEMEGAGSTDYLDLNLTNDSTYTYRLEVIPAQGAALYTAGVPATPGASQPWIGDGSGAGLDRVSPDGRAILFQVDPFREILGLAVAPDSTVWAADYLNGEIVHYDSQGEQLSSWEVAGASALALDARTGDLWVGSFDQSALLLFDDGGNLIWSAGVGLVEAVVAAPSGGVWFAARNAGIGRAIGMHVAFRDSTFQWPLAVGPNPDGSAWVIDRTSEQVSRISSDGRSVTVSPVQYAGPEAGCTDGAGGFWVADPVRGGVSHLNAQLAESAFFAVGPAEDVAWDPAEGRLWVALSSVGEVLVVAVHENGASETGETIATLETGGRPLKIAGLWR